MTEEEAIALAADWYDSGSEDFDEFKAMVRVLIESVTAAEREACAKLADDGAEDEPYGHAKCRATIIAGAIRGRSNA